MAFPTPFNISTVLGIPGPAGPTGPRGIPGKTSDVITDSFIQPSVSATVPVSVADSSFLLVGERVFVLTGGYYVVTGIVSEVSIVLQNTGDEGNAAPTIVIANGSAITVGAAGPEGPIGATGPTGSTGPSGQGAFTSTTSSFVQPAVSGTVSIPVTNSSWIAVGSSLYVSNGGTYIVTAKADSTHFTGENLGYAGSATVGATVATSQSVMPTGLQSLSGRTCTATVGVSGSNADYTCDGTDDDVQIQAALDLVNAAGGGQVVLRAGSYNITNGLQIHSNTAFTGESKFATTIRTTSTGSGYSLPGGSMIYGTDLTNVRVADIRMVNVGLGATAGNGISFDISANPNTSHITLERLRIENSVGVGVYINVPILCYLNDVRIVGVTGDGIWMNNGTSTNVYNCYSQECTQRAYYMFQMVYSTLIGCAGEQSGVHYWFKTCTAMSIISCGSESSIDLNTTYPGRHYYVEGGQDLTFLNCYATAWASGATSGDKSYIETAGTTKNIWFRGFRGNTPSGTGPDNAWKVKDSGSRLMLDSCEFVGVNATVTSGTLSAEFFSLEGQIVSKSKVGDAKFTLDRLSNSYLSHITFKTNGTSEWAIGGYNDSTEDLQFRDLVNSRTDLSIVQSTGVVTASQGFSGKNIRRVAALTDAATVTPDISSFDGGKLLTLSQSTLIANPTGTPTAFQQFTLRITSSSQRALTWGAQFRGSLDIPLPSITSGSSLTDYMGFQWNSDSSTWDLIGVVKGF